MSKRRRHIRYESLQRNHDRSAHQGIGDLDFYYFTAEGIDRQASLTYADVARKQNTGTIDFWYDQAMSNWELNGRRGPEPVKPAYHETDSDKIFQHLQAFRYGNVAVPDDGSGYLSDQGYVAASPWQQQYTGAPATQLTAYSGGQYNQVAMPDKPATPLTSDIFWGTATEQLKPSGTTIGTKQAPRATPAGTPPPSGGPVKTLPAPGGNSPVPAPAEPVQRAVTWAKENPLHAIGLGIALAVIFGGNR